MQRREAIMALAATASVGLAGCTSDSSSDEPTDDEPEDTEAGPAGTDSDPETTGTDDQTTATEDGSPGSESTDPDGEIRMADGLGLEILEYGHVIREREEDSRNDYDEAYDVQGRLELTADVYVNVEVAYEFLDDAGQRIDYYKTSKLMQQGDVWEFSGMYSKDPEDVDGYVLHVSCQSDCSA